MPADEDGVRPLPEVDEHAELVVDLRAAGDEDERPLDVAEQPAEHLELLLEEKAGVRREEVRDALGRRMRSVSRAERVVHVEIHPVGEPLRAVSGSFAVSPGIEARVLEHLEAVVRKELAKSRRHGRHRERRIGALRAAEMRAHGDVRRAAVEQSPQRRQRRADPRVVGDPPVLERDVQVGADEDALAGDVRLTNRARPVHRLRERACRSGRRAGTSSPTRCRTSRTP